MLSEDAKGVPRVTTHSSSGSCTGLSRWMMRTCPEVLVVSAGAKGWWELVFQSHYALSSNLIPTAGGARTGRTHWAGGGLGQKSPPSKPRVQMGGFGQDWKGLVFNQMGFEGEEPLPQRRLQELPHPHRG